MTATQIAPDGRLFAPYPGHVQTEKSSHRRSKPHPATIWRHIWAKDRH